MAYHITIMTATTGPDGDPAFFSDYINNPTKRYQDWTTSVLPDGFWSNYGLVYLEYKAEQKIIFRAKHVDENNHMHVTQVWPDEATREAFLQEVNSDSFDQGRTINVTYNNYNVDNASDIQSLIASVMSSNNCVIQICVPEFRVSGMVIGDVLKGDTLLTVE